MSFRHGLSSPIGRTSHDPAPPYPPSPYRSCNYRCVLDCFGNGMGEMTMENDNTKPLTEYDRWRKFPEKMTPEEALAALEPLAKVNDVEVAHSQADDVMCA